ncbi:MAG: hypothetical protein EA387_04150 [Nitriliruptor sp.]|nr:MAG: hypothetical protein EA387_04150 [Nitriliruptor sp.]
MSIRPPITGHELDPERFMFGSLRIPPDNVLPAAVRTLTAELRDHQTRWRAADTKARELARPDALRTAERSDALLLGEAVRADKPDPGPVNVKALEQALDAERQTMARHEAAGRLIAADLDAKLKEAADKGQAEARAQIETARTEHARALADLEDARSTLITNTAALAYWQTVTAEGSTRWKGRTDGRGASIVAANGQHVPLEKFEQLSSAIRREADRLAAAVNPRSEPL